MIHGALHFVHSTHPAHLARRRKHVRHTWSIIALLVGATVVLMLAGYFAGVAWRDLALALLASTYRLALAYAIALLLGGSISLLLGNSRLSDFFFPFFDVLQNVPSFALIPLFIYGFGYTGLMVTVFAATSIIWPILFSTMTAIRSVRGDIADAASVLGARGVKRTLYFYLPLAYPALLTGSIVGIAIGWEAVIGAEIIAKTGGFGSFIQVASESGFTPPAVAGIVAILVLVFVLNRLIWSPLLAQSAHRYAD